MATTTALPCTVPPSAHVTRSRRSPQARPCRHPGHGQIRPELLGLKKRAARQVLAGDPHGEAQVVLDAGARARLTAGGAGLEHQYVEPFRRGVDGGSEPGWPRAHHDEVVHVPFVEVAVEAERGRHLRIARIAHRPVPVLTHQHRDLADADLEVLEQCVHARVAVDVEIDVRMSVAHQEGLEAQGIRRMARPDQHEPAHGIGDEVRAAEHEGAQEQLAQLGVRLHDVPEVRQVDLEQLGRVQRARADQAVSPGDHVHLPVNSPASWIVSRSSPTRDGLAISTRPSSTT